MKSWLKELREQKAYTQEEVAKKAGIERTTYASIEQGRRNPSVSKAMRIASVLDFDWTIFFDEKLRESTHKQLTKVGG
ncbi:TPA_asm: helix-turn-helix domain-containing protein [Listeria monocytogenes]|nr:helix-turn-helix domain-containing protein [Listeria monocytogenes]HAB7751298.1 helix-turn-helix domain-containing protein [Listeria monocytogenes]HAB7758102.1 helix-turn-helix domain-containing protein [Listeria monocytogenes]HAB7762064.1 helix-turn-helix domain-containing protein [Listeria monocytogenes]HAB7775766.1 helix-turn-helix domain-containing protein [Listeria monocytogenes]